MKRRGITKSTAAEGAPWKAESNRSPAPSPIQSSRKRATINGTPHVDVPPTKQRWSELIPPEEWAVYARAIQSVRETGADFLLGGAFGLAVYTGRWRNTKDIDFFVLPEVKDRIIAALEAAGFTDFHSELPYDRGWIYRAVQKGVIVDVIWGMPNRRTQVDASWIQHATPALVRKELLLTVPAEELVWIKLYVLQRDRSDWPDVLNLLHATAARLNWKRLLDRMEQDVPLLTAILNVFLWLFPQQAEQIPEWVRHTLHLPTPGLPQAEFERVPLLDTRPWFAALQPAHEPMKI
ncbi:MAG: nucleotidyltransferase family protein [Verrucomicrobiota bacterium]